MTNKLSPNAKIFIAGHNGMVGSALLRQLTAQGYHNQVVRSREELDLTDQMAVKAFFSEEKIDCVILAAAKVGGIHANNEYPAEFIYQNLMMECNVIHQAYQAGVKELLFLGSSCIYPKLTPQPMSESALLSGALEPTNEPYAIAKISGIKLCESYNRQYGVCYKSLMPTNLYGPNDNFHPENSHVIPALIRKFHEAKINSRESVEIWGTGNVRREFLHVDDLAAACIHLLNMSRKKYQELTSEQCSHINVGSGSDMSIAELAESIKHVVGFDGKVVFDSSKPEGTPKKLLDVSVLEATGWKQEIHFDSGIKSVYEWFVNTESGIRAK